MTALCKYASKLQRKEIISFELTRRAFICRFEDHATEDQCQQVGDIEHNDARDGQIGDRSRERVYNIMRLENEPWDEGELACSKENLIADREINGIVDGDEPHSKHGHRVAFSRLIVLRL